MGVDWSKKIDGVWDGLFVGFFECDRDLSSAFCTVDLGDEVLGVGMLVSGLSDNIMASLLEVGHDGFNTTEDMQMWEDLRSISAIVMICE